MNTQPVVKLSGADRLDMRDECLHQMIGEIRDGEVFCFTFEDCEAANEYRDYFTDSQLRTIFKSALRQATA